VVLRLDPDVKEYAVYEMLALNQVYEQAAELDKYKSAAFPEWAHSCYQTSVLINIL